MEDGHQEAQPQPGLSADDILAGADTVRDVRVVVDELGIKLREAIGHDDQILVTIEETNTEPEPDSAAYVERGDLVVKISVVLTLESEIEMTVPSLAIEHARDPALLVNAMLAPRFGNYDVAVRGAIARAIIAWEDALLNR